MPHGFCHGKLSPCCNKRDGVEGGILLGCIRLMKDSGSRGQEKCEGSVGEVERTPHTCIFFFFFLPCFSGPCRQAFGVGVSPALARGWMNAGARRGAQCCLLTVQLRASGPALLEAVRFWPVAAATFSTMRLLSGQPPNRRPKPRKRVHN